MDLKVTERFRRVSDKTIEYRATMEDPTTWTKPWSIELPLIPCPDRFMNTPVMRATTPS
jgi:hypothetical protein